MMVPPAAPRKSTLPHRKPKVVKGVPQICLVEIELSVEAPGGDEYVCSYPCRRRRRSEATVTIHFLPAHAILPQLRPIVKEAPVRALRKEICIVSNLRHSRGFVRAKVLVRVKKARRAPQDLSQM